MAPIRNARVILNERPTGYTEPGKTLVYDGSRTIDIDNFPLNGGFITKTLELSIDPVLIVHMRETDESYYSFFPLGAPIYGPGIALVVKSESSDVKVGDHVYGDLMHEEYGVRASLGDLTVIRDKHGLPWSVYLGAAGMPGQTAFVGWKEFVQPKKGNIIFVTSGGGSVGSFVIQLAKADGLKVIASAGSDDKVAFMKEIGADVSFNYKTMDTREVLHNEGPIDIFWDHVGGEILDIALENANIGAQFIECGMISEYTNNGGIPVKNLRQTIIKDISLRGFFVYRSLYKYIDEFYATVPGKVAKGEIKYREDITHGLSKVGDVLLGVEKGENKGKAVIHVADE